MAKGREPNHAMPANDQRREEGRTTQPTRRPARAQPNGQDEGLGTFVGQGGHTDIAYKGPNSEEGGEIRNPDAAAERV